MDRDDFAVRQARMTEQWYENVRRKHANVGAYVNTRQTAYLGRWQEALRYIRPGSRILDIGGGNIFPVLLHTIRERCLDYWYLDVDPGSVQHARALTEEFGMDPTRCGLGLNDRLDFPDASFDAVFSSHCIEHSPDLGSTLAEVRRVLKPGGVFTIAVPFGWEENPEHPYFLGPDHWHALIEDAGFSVRQSSLGSDYPESGFDLFIAANRSDLVAPSPRIRAAGFVKDKLDFIPIQHEAFEFSGNVARLGDRIVCRDDWSVRISLKERPVRRVLPIFHRHDWSGIVQIDCATARTIVDLYSNIQYPQPVEVEVPPSVGNSPVTVSIQPIGKCAMSRGREAVLVGALVEYHGA